MFEEANEKCTFERCGCEDANKIDVRWPDENKETHIEIASAIGKANTMRVLDTQSGSALQLIDGGHGPSDQLLLASIYEGT